MKNWNWKQWTAFGLTVAVIIAGVVLHFVQPQVSYAFNEAMFAVGCVVGTVVGYMLTKTQD